MKISRQEGFTLIEMLIAVAIGMILMTVVYSLMVGQSRALTEARKTTEMQDNVRVALDMLARDLRNAGGLLGDKGLGLRIENNCGNSATAGLASGMIDVAAGVFTVPGVVGNAINANGEIQGDTFNGGFNGCPNGSDRVSMTFQPVKAFLAPSTSSQSGNDPSLNLICPNNNCLSAFIAAGVQPAATLLSPGGGTSNPIKLCNSTNPYDCYEVTFTTSSGECPPSGSANCTVQVQSYPSGSNFNSFCGDSGGQHWKCLANPGSTSGKYTASVGSFSTVTYQLMDQDQDGSTELVQSPDIGSFLAGYSTATPATWTPVANYIDDLQFAIHFQGDQPGFFHNNYSLWNLTGSGGACTESGTPAPNSLTAARVCLENHLLPAFGTGALDPSGLGPPMAIRVTVVARTAKIDLAAVTGSVNTDHGIIEDNTAPYQVFSTFVPAVGGAFCYGGRLCGCGPVANGQSALTCEGSFGNAGTGATGGNLQGYRRRVVTEIIGLRNYALGASNL